MSVNSTDANLRNQVVMFELGIDLDKLKMNLKLPAEKLIVGTGVRLAEQKGITYLLKAIKLMSQKRDDFCVVIAGDGPLRASLVEEAVQLGVGNLVHFIGERTDIHDVIKLFDVYVLPSIWEGLPLVLPEAQAAKRAIVAADVGGVNQVIDNGKNGTLVPSKDPEALVEAIVDMLDNPGKRASFASAGYDTFKEKFSLEISARQYIDEYNNILKQ